MVVVTALTEIRGIYAECWRETLHGGDGTVGVTTSCKRRAGFRFSAEERDFSVFHNFQTGSVAHPASGCSFPGGKEAGV
jgi:hypothetical protein